MTEDNFWEIISQIQADSQDEQLKALTAALNRLEPDEIISFQALYNTLLDRAYRWDLWGAAYVINGGCSDDGFDYFCDWLISRGRTVFEAAIADPETLADTDWKNYAQFEEFRYVARDVYASNEGTDMDLPVRSSGGLVGDPFDEGTVEKSYPRLTEAVIAADEAESINDESSKNAKYQKLIALGKPSFSEENMRSFDERLTGFIDQKLSGAGAIHNHVCLVVVPGKTLIEARCWSVELADGRTLHAAKYVIDFGDAPEGIPEDALTKVQAHPQFYEPPQTQEQIMDGLMKGVRPKPSMDEEVGQATDQALKSGSGQPIIASAERVGPGSLRLTFENAPECRSLTLYGCDKNGSGDVHGVLLVAEGETLCLSRLGVELKLPNTLWGW